MKKLPIMVLLVAVVLACIIYISFRLNLADKVNNYLADNFNWKASSDNENPNNEEDTQNTGNTNHEEGGGGDGSGSGGGESSSSQPSGCSLEQISYSLTDFEKTSVCNTYEGETCIDKTITCSLVTTNLDFETSGLFEIMFSFFEKDSQDVLFSEPESDEPIQDNEQQVLFSSTDSNDLSPYQSKTFQGIANFQDENANKEITCSFSAVQVPKKEICSS